jgi:hypothetical protein
MDNREILVVGGLLFGMILGRFFKWYVLVPACGLAIALVLANPTDTDSFLGLFIHVVMVTASLQLGYLIRLMALYFLSGSESRSKKSKNSLIQTIRL